MISGFSPDDFKQWLQQQGSFSAAIPRANLMGLSVYSATPKRKLAPHMCVREGTLEELVIDFSKHGGTVIDIDGKHVVIEVKSGSFSIPECCIRR